MTVIITDLPFINRLLYVLSNMLGYLCQFYFFCAVSGFFRGFYCLYFADKDNSSLRCDCGSPDGGSNDPSSFWAGPAFVCPVHVREVLTNIAEEGVMLAKQGQSR